MTEYDQITYIVTFTDDEDFECNVPVDEAEFIGKQGKLLVYEYTVHDSVSHLFERDLDNGLGVQSWSVKKNPAAVSLGSMTSEKKAKSSRANGKLGGRPTLREQAERRVNASPQLSRYRDTIMYDWPEGDTHWRWIISKPIAEIIDWAKAVK